MNADKQIEEMAKFFMSLETYDYKECEECGKWEHDRCDEYCFSQKVATDLYNAGYRKASEVAREVVEDMREMIKGYENIDVYLDRIEKKYTESENDNG